MLRKPLRRLILMRPGSFTIPEKKEIRRSVFVEAAHSPIKHSNNRTKSSPITPLLIRAKSKVLMRSARYRTNRKLDEVGLNFSLQSCGLGESNKWINLAMKKNENEQKKKSSPLAIIFKGKSLDRNLLRRLVSINRSKSAREHQNIESNKPLVRGKRFSRLQERLV